MRRPLVVLAMVLAALVGAGTQVLTDGGDHDDRQVADVMPFPRSTSPLPVPEVSIQQGPWRDDVPFTSPTTVLPDAEGFVGQCTGNTPPCVVKSPRSN